VGGRTEEAFCWSTSLISLLYSVLNCPLPFFILPLASWIADNLLGMVYFIWAIEPIRIVLLAIMGCLFSFLMLKVLLKPANSASSRSSLKTVLESQAATEHASI